MYLNEPTKNSLTIGKYLRKQKQLRKKDPKAKLLPLTPQLKNYKAQLQERGLQVNGIDVGLFQTRNGLKYPGFMATEKIKANSVLLRVPVDCLLTTRDAFLSEIQKVFEQNPKFYAKTFSSDWEDRIILTYLLFEWQKGKNSKWYNLLLNLPRDIDYVAFWSKHELQSLQDTWVQRSIVKQRVRVLQQQKELIAISKRYPQFFKPQIFTQQNLTWIHVHLVTRCFGKYFQYTTMVPYAQLFNHQCVDVYYTMDYYEDNPHNPHEVLDEPTQLTEQDQEEVDTSEGSYEASDVSAQDQEFQEKEIQEEQILEKCHPSVASEYRTIQSYLVAFINFNDQVSLPFLARTYEAMEDAMKEEKKAVALKRFEKIHSKNVRYLKLVKQFFFKIKSRRYSYGLRQRKGQKDKNKSQKQQVDPTVRYFQGAWPKDKFDDFLMVCGRKDQFEEGSQVYFCYGRLPNRLLLMRYGIALQHNKYNHFFLRIDISDYVYQNKPLQRGVQMDIALKKYKRFKIKRTVFCFELITFHRAILWKYQEDVENIFFVHDIQREKVVLKTVEKLFKEQLQQFSCTPEQNQQKLQDKTVDYHQYFAIVYRLEQQRIILEQLRMIKYAQHILKQLQEGDGFIKVLKEEEDKQKLRLQIMMEPYFDSIRCF